MNEGYFRQPTVAGDQVVFVCEDDLWTVPLAGGTARRLTSGRGAVSMPSLSPDGTLLAFASSEEAHSEIWVCAADGGPATRVTFLGGLATPCGWTTDGRIAFASDTAQPLGGRVTALYTVSPDGGPITPLPYGPARSVAFGPNGAVAIGRHTTDPARWKRYRGGTAGQIWVDADGDGAFARILTDLPTNFGAPLWIGERMFAISDHDGIGNVWSFLPDGSDLRPHTHHRDFYARYPSTDGRTIVYHAGADLYRLDLGSDRSERIDVELHSPQVQRARRFVDAGGTLQGYSLHPDGSAVAVEARGRALTMPLWEGAPRQWGARNGVRYRLGQWLHDGETFVAVSDEGNDEGLDVFPDDSERTRIEHDLGRVVTMTASPVANLLAVTNHRWEILLVDVDAGTVRTIDSSEHAQPGRVAWSPDGSWIAYAYAPGQRTSQIRLARIDGAKEIDVHDVTRADFWDYEPSFDPDGAHLSFLSARVFDPVYDHFFFDLGFPRGMRPMLVTLRADAPSPFVRTPRALDAPASAKDESDDDDAKDEDKDASSDEKDDKDTVDPVLIDLEGIADRVLAYPVPEGIYGSLRAASGRVFFTASDVEGALNRGWGPDEGDGGARLEYWDFAEHEHETLVRGVRSFEVNAAHKTILYRSGRRLRAIGTGAKPDDKKASDPGRASGWIDLSRLKISLDPVAEWRQMLREAWRLQRDHFWTSDMSGVDWPAVLDRYLPLVDRVASRREFSDLMWELQGELGTSHAYEMGGDHRRPPAYQIGLLGADLEHDAKSGQAKIVRIPRGDSWIDDARSPLADPGVDIAEGDVIVEVGGLPVDARTSLGELLVNQADTRVDLRVTASDGTNARSVTVRTLDSDTQLRYRDWVEHNRSVVEKQSGGRLGYVHVPDMGARGYSEFHRYLNAELEHDGLVVDVRFNGGGHVSQLLLEKLMRRRLAYVVRRYGAPEPYPSDTLLGPIVAITNETAGSDGDIFSHSFKQLGLGPLVGTRTWGGVVGISPQHVLADGSVTTQPEYSFWFTDVDWGVENFGTEPTHVVEITPQQHAAGEDPQLDTAIRLALDAMATTPPVLPDFSERPNLALPV